MKKIHKYGLGLCLISGISLLLFQNCSNGSSGSSSNPSSNIQQSTAVAANQLQGESWASPCVSSSASASTQQVYLFGENNQGMIQVIGYGASNCTGTPIVTMSLTGTYALGGASSPVAGATALRITWPTSAVVLPNQTTTATEFNQTQYCGLSNWQVGVGQSIALTNSCLSSTLGSSLTSLTSILISGSKFYLANSSNTAIDYTIAYSQTLGAGVITNAKNGLYSVNTWTCGSHNILSLLGASKVQFNLGVPANNQAAVQQIMTFSNSCTVTNSQELTYTSPLGITSSVGSTTCSSSCTSSQCVAETPSVAPTVPFTYILQSNGTNLLYHELTSADVGNNYLIYKSMGCQAGDLVTMQFASTAVAPVGQYITAFSMTAEGTHSTSSQCANSGNLVGTVEDCGSGKCAGAQLMCTTPMTSAPTTSPVMAQFWMTQAGTHVANGGGCPSGYTQLGSVVDCGGGVCNGNQLFCAEFAPDASANLSVVKNIYVSPLGAHATSAPNCPSGYSVIGYLADCGGAVCSGYQSVCVEMGL